MTMNLCHYTWKPKIVYLEYLKNFRGKFSLDFLWLREVPTCPTRTHFQFGWQFLYFYFYILINIFMVIDRMWVKSV